MLFRITASVALVCCSLCAEKKPVTIDTLMQTGRRGDTGGTAVWAPGGKRFLHASGKKVLLYDVDSKTDKELFVLDPLEAAAAKVPPEAAFGWQNRRVRQESLQWSPNGADLLIAQSGDLFLWHLASGKWDQLTNTPVVEADPKLSPDGKSICFRRGHDLFVMDVATRQVKSLTEGGTAASRNGELDWVYPEELDLGSAFWWSPDSKRIAYMQFNIADEFEYPQVDLKHRRALLEIERYPQAGTPNAQVRIGVVSARGGPTKWMETGAETDHLIARVDWTPDSQRLGIQRLNRVQNQLDFLLADAGSGSSHAIIHETDPFWINIADQSQFLKDGRLLWSSERDGFRHLYLFDSNGKQISRLTEGPWEVTNVAGVDEANQLVYFVSSEVSPIERQFYSVKLDGSGKTRLSEGAGTHAISMSPACDYYLDTYSNLHTPPSRTVHKAGGAEWAVYRQADHKLTDDTELLPVEIVTAKAADGATPLYGKLTKPANFQTGRKYPLIVMVYGGPGAQSVRDTWTGVNWDQVLAQNGFLVWELDNRGSIGRGHKFESILYHRFGKTELEDQLAGIHYLESQGSVDTARIGMYGWSYGGFMTLYSLLNAPDTFKVGIAGAPVTDWHNYDTIYTERYLGLPSENEAGYRASSDVTYANQLKAKLLILHNIEDDNVLFQNTLQMSDALEKADKLFGSVIYSQKTHGVSGPERRHLLELTTRFFEENLK